VTALPHVWPVDPRTPMQLPSGDVMPADWVRDLVLAAELADEMLADDAREHASRVVDGEIRRHLRTRGAAA
jgi:hypothetical protein